MLNNLPSEFKTYLESLFIYNEETGDLIAKWRDYGPNPTPRQKQRNTVHANKKIGFLKDGYMRVGLPNNKQMYVHQIAFILKEGWLPKNIDHKNLIRSDNKWSNLRAASCSQNASNCKKRKTNKSGLKGVCWAKSNNCWRMNIQFNKKCYYSYHKTKEEAYSEYCKMSNLLHKEYGNV